jgi:hypothetical protein
VRTDDWIGDSDALLNKLRPSRLRYDVAIVAAAIALGLCAVWAVRGLHIPGQSRYEFDRDGSTIYVMDRMTGSVAACHADGTAVTCGEEDSADAAEVRSAIGQ